MRILVVDDHSVVVDGLTRLLSLHFDADVLEAATAESALAIYADAKPDVVILDLNLPDIGGLEVLRRLRTDHPSARIIVFSMHHEPVYAARALRGGADGYVSKSAPVDELVAGIRAVTAGKTYVERAIAERLNEATATDADPLRALTVREIEILRMLGEGKSMSSIADALGIAYKTVANICTGMKVKLGVDRTADLIRLAVETMRPR